MIKANELRIGNWLMLSGNHRPFIWTLEHFKDEFKEPDKSYYFEPIPITPEILNRARFVEQMGRYGVYSKDRLRIVSGTGALAYLIDEDDSRAGYYIPHPIQYLHQLQNLYFALTGTELQINL